MQSLWIIVSTFFTAASYALIKGLNENWTFFEIFFVRMFFILIVTLALAFASGTSLKTQYPIPYATRTVCGILALCLNIVVVQHLPLGTAQTLIFTTPIFVACWTIIHKTLERLPISVEAILSVLLGFTGILFVLRPTVEGSLFYALLALISAFSSAVVSITLKELGKMKEPILRSVFYFALGGVLLAWATCFFYSDKTFSVLLSEPVLLAVGFTSAASQLAQAQGWGKGKTFLCANLQFTAVIFAFVFGFLFFQENLDVLTGIGILIIVFSEFWTAKLQLNKQFTSFFLRTNRPT